MPMSFSHIAKGALVALFLMVAPAVFAQQPVQFDTEPLIIQTAAGKRLNFTVEIADTNEQRQRGLMYRKEMAEDAGMIFDFGTSRRVQMWMENTILPLDMLFVDAAGVIRGIKQNAVPYSEDIIDSVTAVKYVVELNAGVTAKLGIKPGDRMLSATTTRKK
ncbi:DUF192 domain-containing protein [Rhizobium grahamii]|uniref:DUF192 domain-containing protein n=1 Tax=Rhizobium grahamii TaxID=1120045 RepID=A0A5Q0CA12_9HYPH|nr:MULTISPECIES: DUF192 domain-containing protein [Rhizobium]QFY60509.1 DUF192 domain-containing protein [Rhizobium grahamii]QRM50363.1 DUF192 domain-containing protein [Rhizobium sp. BG6]